MICEAFAGQGLIPCFFVPQGYFGLGEGGHGVRPAAGRTGPGKSRTNDLPRYGPNSRESALVLSIMPLLDERAQPFGCGAFNPSPSQYGVDCYGAGRTILTNSQGLTAPAKLEAAVHIPLPPRKVFLYWISNCTYNVFSKDPRLERKAIIRHWEFSRTPLPLRGI